MTKPTQPTFDTLFLPEPLRPVVVPTALHEWNTAVQQERARRERAERDARKQADDLRAKIERREAERGKR